MWTIRKDQLDSLDQAVQRKYCEDLMRLFRERFPQLVAHFDDQVLLERIGAGVQRARAYGMRTGAGTLAYVGLSLAAGPAFHSDPKIRNFLKLPGDSPDQKVHWLFKRVLEKLQQMAKGNGDSKPLR